MLARMRRLGGREAWAGGSVGPSDPGPSRRRLWGVAVLTASMLALATEPASAIEFTVTRNDDPAPGACDADCSLREAVIASNQANSVDFVLLPAGTYTLSIAGSGGANQGDLDITDTVYIENLGPSDAVIDANGDVTGDRGLELAGGGAVLYGDHDRRRRRPRRRGWDPPRRRRAGAGEQRLRDVRRRARRQFSPGGRRPGRWHLQRGRSPAARGGRLPGPSGRDGRLRWRHPSVQLSCPGQRRAGRRYVHRGSRLHRQFPSSDLQQPSRIRGRASTRPPAGSLVTRD